MAQKFEVGKTYKSTYTNRTFNIQCIGTYRSFVRYNDGVEGLVHNADATLCDEYHEPKIEKFVKFVMRYMDKAPFTADRRFFDNTQLGKIEITLTDGKLSSVDIVEGE